MEQVEGRGGVLLYGHGGSANRGCEAILRSSAAIIRSGFPGARITVASLRADEDRAAGVLDVDYLAEGHREIRRLSPAWVRRTFLSRVLRDRAGAWGMHHQHVVEAARAAAVSLSVGGDNYCYGAPWWLYGIDRAIRRGGGRTVLWGASVEPSGIDREMRADLAGFDLVIARESITFEALSGVNRAVHLHPDPAFTLAREDLPLPDGWVPGRMLGLNVSPMAMSFERSRGGLLRAASALVEHVLRTTDLSVALVPHVSRPGGGGDDLEPLSALARVHGATGRVVLLPGTLTAPQYKGYIARCALFLGARTHATIAAYSSGVPTVAIGYSVKARGIARDLFGDESLVVPVQALEDDRALVTAFEALRERAPGLRALLEARVPALRRDAAAAAERLRAVMA
jgi:polysaccharide pyruvyl transferase WcaK-like protein